MGRLIYFRDFKTHGSVSCGPRSCRTTPWAYWQEDKECNFYTYVTPRSLTWIQPNLLLRCLGEFAYQFIANRTSQSWDTSEQNFKIISLFFLLHFAYFAFLAITLWNTIPHAILQIKKSNLFCAALHHFLFWYVFRCVYLCCFCIVCVKVFIVFVLCECVVCTICLWEVRLEACFFCTILSFDETDNKQITCEHILLSRWHLVHIKG